MVDFFPVWDRSLERLVKETMRLFLITTFALFHGRINGLPIAIRKDVPEPQPTARIRLRDVAFQNGFSHYTLGPPPVGVAFSCKLV